MHSNEIRRRFLDYFAEKGHRVLRSSSLLPVNDPTLLFTNAGMNQFKDVFLGKEKRDYARAATAQKCMRAGGKHNDLENVGYTNRHLTFFEMLGNFSFGDYFKRDAIRFAWQLLTEGFGLPAERLHATVYQEDDEAHRLWKDDVGLPLERVQRLGAGDNFWAMGDTGPCGPCSELHIDTTLAGCGRPGCAPGCDCGRFVELWNLVFMQFERGADLRLTPLPSPSIDTGMGLERIAMVLQGKSSVFETDLLLPVIEATALKAGVRYGEDPKRDVALRVIADHLRATSFLIADGGLPSNEGRGYVLRRILRRATRFGKRLDFEQPFLFTLVPVLAGEMGQAYPELAAASDRIARAIRGEEERFERTIAHAKTALEEVSAAVEARGETTVPGADAFRLYDTFGLPLDTLKDLAEVRGLKVDEPGFAEHLERARATARASWKGGSARSAGEAYQSEAAREPVVFLGYQATELDAVEVRAILREGREVEAAQAGERCEVILERTPFYPEGGGQVGDRGLLLAPGLLAEVEDTRRPLPGLVVHRALIRQGTLRRGDVVEARVEAERRQSLAQNHSGTHLLHAALRQVLGEHVKQAGSLVAPDRLRFDFSHYRRIEADDRRRIQALVNQRIGLNDRVLSEVVPIEEALRRGALAFFGDRYGEEVRVVRMGDFSLELCGGTHVDATGGIGYFALVGEGGISSGVRRLEAVTGEAAVLSALADRELVEELAGRMHVPAASLVSHLETLQKDLKDASKEIALLRLKLASGGTTGGAETRDVAGVQLTVRRVEALDAPALRNLADEMKKRLKSGVIVLGSENQGKASLLVAVSADLLGRVPALVVAKELAKKLGGSGGGRPDLAQAGGPQVENLGAALDEAEVVIERLLAASGTALDLA